MSTTSEDLSHNTILNTGQVEQQDKSITKYVTYLKIRQWDTVLGVVSFAKKQVPQPTLLGLFLELRNNGDDGLPS